MDDELETEISVGDVRFRILTAPRGLALRLSDSTEVSGFVVTLLSMLIARWFRRHVRYKVAVLRGATPVTERVVWLRGAEDAEQTEHLEAEAIRLVQAGELLTARRLPWRERRDALHVSTTNSWATRLVTVLMALLPVLTVLLLVLFVSAITALVSLVLGAGR